MKGRSRFTRSRSKSRSKGRKVAYSRKTRGKIVKGFTRSSGLYGRFGPTGRKIEQKYLDMTLTSTLCTFTPVFIGRGAAGNSSTYFVRLNSTGANTDYLCSIQPGSGPSMRVGRKCFLKSLSYDIDCLQIEDSANGDEQLRIWVVQDTQTNGALCSASDVLGNGTVLLPHSFKNVANEHRFKILDYKIINLRPGASGSTSGKYAGVIRNIKGYVPLNFNVEFAVGDTDAAIGNCRSNSIHLMVSSSCPTGITSDLNTYINGSFRLRYTDL